jgi:hypothetical protein
MFEGRVPGKVRASGGGVDWRDARTFIVCTLTKCDSDQIKEVAMGGTCGTCGCRRNVYTLWL